jgi:hypothetical protein
MHSISRTHYMRVVWGLLLELVTLPALCGTVFAPGASLAAKGGNDRKARPDGHHIGRAIAVSRAKHHKKKRKKKRVPGGAAAPAPAGVGPLRTSNCFSVPHLCGFPDPTNTGVPLGVRLVPSGSLRITQPGAVVSGLLVTGTIDVQASNVTIENTRVIQNATCGPINTCGNSAIEIAPGLERALLHACDSNV